MHDRLRADHAIEQRPSRITGARDDCAVCVGGICVERHSVIVTVHGEPAVEIRAFEKLPVDIDARIAELTARGVIRPAKARVQDYTWKPRARKRAGGLDRFLKERADNSATRPM